MFTTRRFLRFYSYLSVKGFVIFVGIMYPHFLFLDIGDYFCLEFSIRELTIDIKLTKMSLIWRNKKYTVGSECEVPKQEKLLWNLYSFVSVNLFNWTFLATNRGLNMSDDGISKREILSLIARVAALSAFSYFTMKWLIDALDPSRFVHFFPEPIILNVPSKPGLWPLTITPDTMIQVQIRCVPYQHCSKMGGGVLLWETIGILHMFCPYKKRRTLGPYSQHFIHEWVQ